MPERLRGVSGIQIDHRRIAPIRALDSRLRPVREAGARQAKRAGMT